MPKTLGEDLADKGNRYLRRPSVVDASSSSTSCPRPQTEVPLVSSSKLATLLIRGVLWGGMSAVFASEIARASVADGLAFPDLKQLARLGTSGSHKCHIWRDFKKCLKPSPIRRALRNVTVPVKVDAVTVRRGEIGILYPHELFSVMHEHYYDHFLKYILGGNVNNVSDFWSQMDKHPSFKDHPMHRHRLFNFRTHAVPIVVYGDGTPVTGVSKAWCKEVDGIIWSSALMHDDRPWLHNYIMCFLYELLLYKSEAGERITEDEVWKEIVWSLYWLGEGVHPDRGSDNVVYTDAARKAKAHQPLAGGYFGPVWVLAGDLDYMHKRILLADYNKPGEPCSCCSGNNTDAPWADGRDLLAVWMSRLWTNSSYALAKPDRHRLLKHLPGVGICNYIPDTMHCKNLGGDRSFLGSALRNLTHHILPGDPATNLKLIWKDIKILYASRKTRARFGVLTANMIQPARAKLPELKGKAAQIRSLGPIMVEVWKKRMDPGNAQHRDILSGLKSSAEIDKILRVHRRCPRFPDHVALQFRKHCFNYYEVQASLIQFYHPGIPLHNVTLKSHYLLHLGLMASYINPALGSCWQGEDMMRHIRKLVGSCANGSSPALAARTAMFKYSEVLGFEFDQML